MSIRNAIASIAVEDLAKSRQWYEALFERAADSNLEAQVTELQKLQIDTSARTANNKVKTVMITDPDGNHIGLAQSLEPSLARATKTT